MATFSQRIHIEHNWNMLHTEITLEFTKWLGWESDGRVAHSTALKQRHWAKLCKCIFMRLYVLDAFIPYTRSNHYRRPRPISRSYGSRYGRQSLFIWSPFATFAYYYGDLRLTIRGGSVGFDMQSFVMQVLIRFCEINDTVMRYGMVC